MTRLVVGFVTSAAFVVLALLETSSTIMIIVYMAGLGLIYLQAVAR